MCNIEILLKFLGIKPNNINFYKEALTHQTFANENNYDKNYQRLEFLGDSIISKIVVEFLFINFPKASEGEMSLLKAKFVKGDTFFEIAKKIDLSIYIRAGKSKDTLLSKKIMEDVFEALIGAIYLDQGEKVTKKIIAKFILSKIQANGLNNIKNPKTILQEYLQTESRENIKYVTKIFKNGFKSSIYHDEKLFGIGTGKTKKEAEVNAAKKALKILKEAP